MYHPVRNHLVAALLLALAITCGLGWLLGARLALWLWLGCWLVAVNIVTFFFYGYDKRQAGRSGGRVPEVVLHTLSAVGGSPGAALAMAWFRHKTIKGSFRILFWCIVLLQAAALGWLAKAHWWP